jgi:hypothetical protein
MSYHDLELVWAESARILMTIPQSLLQHVIERLIRLCSYVASLLSQLSREDKQGSSRHDTTDALCVNVVYAYILTLIGVCVVITMLLRQT